MRLYPGPVEGTGLSLVGLLDAEHRHVVFGGYQPGTWQVVYTVGWGDCQAGCIDQHTWTYQVTPDGTVTLISEEGSPVPSGGGGAS